jgi:hypothetical protein
MKIFRVKPNTTEYQRFIPTDETIWARDTLNMDCQSKISDWPEVEVYVFNPKKKRADISYMGPGGFLINERAFEALRSPLEMTTEVLPIRHEDEILYLVNVLECVNCLDRKATTFAQDDKGTPIYFSPKIYVFFPTRLPECSLMKIPETSRSQVLCISDMVDPEDDFIEIVKSEKLSGVEFVELWSRE